MRIRCLQHVEHVYVFNAVHPIYPDNFRIKPVLPFWSCPRLHFLCFQPLF